MHRVIILCLLLLVSVHDTAGQCDGFAGVIQIDDNSAAGHSFSRTSDGGYLLAGVSSNFGSGGLDWTVTKLDASMQVDYAKAIGWTSNESGTNIIIEELSDQTFIHAGYRQINGGRTAIINKFSATGDLMWSKQIESTQCTPRDIEETNDGGILISGTVEVGSSVSSDAFILKMTADGDFLWGHRFDSSEGNEHFYGIAVDDAGLIYCAGNTEGFAGNHRAFIVKLNQTGVVLDQQVLNSGAFSLLLDISVGNGNELLLAGYENVGGGRNGIVFKTDLDLNFIWQKAFSYSNITTGVFVELDVQGRAIAGFASGEGENFLAIAHINYDTGDLVSTVRTEAGQSVDSQIISNIFQSGPDGDVGVVSSDNFSLYSFDSCLSSPCQSTTSPEVMDGNYGPQGYTIPFFDMPNIVDVSPTVVDMTLDVNSDCASQLEFDVSVDGECPGDEFIFELVDVSDPAQIETVVWSVTGFDNFSGNPATLLINDPGNYNWEVFVTTVAGEVVSQTGSFEVLEIPNSEDIDLPAEGHVCAGETLQLDFTPYLDEWDSVLDSEGNELTDFNSSTPGVYEFTFYSPCIAFEHELELTVAPDYAIESEPFGCLNSSVEVSLSPEVNLENTDTELSIDWGDQTSTSSYDGESTSHIYETTGTFDILVQGLIDDCPVDASTSIEVQEQPSFNLIDTARLCFDETFELDFSTFDFNIVNDAGFQVEFFETNVTGNYTFAAENFCGEDQANVVVIFEEINPTQLQFPGEICAGRDTVLLGFESSDYTYQWSDGSETPAIEATEEGVYHVLVSSVGTCIRDYSFTLSAQDPVDLSLFPDDVVKLCSEGNRKVILPYFGIDYHFPDGSAGLAYEVEESEILQLEFTDGCYDYDVDIEIVLYDCLCPVYIPNAFTPDGDGLNDIFKAVANCPLETFHMQIFNRWGNLVFESRDIDRGWNGHSLNKSFYSSNEVYTYLVTYTQRLDGVILPTELKGHVTLLR